MEKVQNPSNSEYRFFFKIRKVKSKKSKAIPVAGREGP
jgi:hypothetical protein